MKSLKLILFFTFIPFVYGHCQPEQVLNKEGKLVEINNTEIFVRIIGEGEPIIVIHGGPVLDHSYLLPHFRQLSKNYKLIFFDQRLSGRSSAEVDTADINMENFVDDIDALGKELNLGSAHILGHSWGGLLAMKFALTYPARTKTLVLLNTMPPSTDLWQQEQQLLSKSVPKEDSLARQKIMQSGLLSSNPPEAVRQLLMLSYKNQFYDPDRIKDLDLYIPEDYMSRSAKFGLLMPELSEYHLTDALKELRMPTLIIYGSAEASATLAGPVIKNQIANSELVIIEKSGHFPFIEQPVAFNRAVRSFLEKH